MISKEKDEPQSEDHIEEPQAKPVLAEPDGIYRWYYENMNEDEQLVYSMILGAIQNRQTELELDHVPSKTVDRLFTVITSEYPELFYNGSSYRYYYEELKPDEIVSIELDYPISDEQYQSMMEEVKAVTEPLIEEIKTQSGSLYNAELMAHDWIVENVDYQSEEGHEGKQDYQTIYGAFVNGKANCMGYASAMEYLMQQLGIPCVNIIGTSRDQNESDLHQWNMVRLDDEWYHVDACWDDPTFLHSDNTDSTIENTARHEYFNLNDEQISVNHNLGQNLDYLGRKPQAAATAMNYFNQTGISVDTVEQLDQVLMDNFWPMMNEGKVLEIHFTDPAVFSQLDSTLPDLLEGIRDIQNYQDAFAYISQKSDDTNHLMLELKPGMQEEQ